MITCSSDCTVKLWDLKGSNFSSSQTFYDHEEEVISGCCSQLNPNLIATMDVEGTVIVRDLRAHDIVSTIKLDRSFESGQIMFNSKMKEELFVAYNNEIELYSIEGAQI